MFANASLFSTPMWRPTDPATFEQAVGDGALDERHDFDAKRELPANKELAKDLAAMSTDGGCLVFGVGEDESGRPRILNPIELGGAAQRIDQVAQQSISGELRIEFTHLWLDEEAGRGYLLVLIEPSLQAPHQVTVGNDRRFYGRSDTGNRRLSEAEIARLYERRALRTTDREKLLATCIANSPVGQPHPGEQGFLQAFANPVPPDDGIWDAACEKSGGESALLEELRAALLSVGGGWGGTDLTSALDWTRRGADSWSLDRSLQRGGEDLLVNRLVRTDLAMDGRAYLFFGGAAELSHPNDEPVLWLHERGIAVNLAQFFSVLAAYYRAAGFHGPLDVGIAVTGIRGAFSAARERDRYDPPSAYGDEAAYRHERCHSRELIESPLVVSQRLLARLFRASYGADFDPLAVEPT